MVIYVTFHCSTHKICHQLDIMRWRYTNTQRRKYNIVKRENKRTTLWCGEQYIWNLKIIMMNMLEALMKKGEQHARKDGWFQKRYRSHKKEWNDMLV
jgi:hypothetical protein